MTSPYGTVVFDFGGVFTGSPFLTLSRAVTERGVDAEAGLYEVFGDYARDTDHPWHRLERGEISFMDARGEIMDSSSATLGVQLDLIELFAAFTSDANARPDMVELARRIGASGRTVGLLTNNLAEFNDGWRSLLPVDELFSQVVDSSREGMRKPDPAIYHLTQERLGVDDPASVLFLDDAEGNIVAARDVGWHAVRVEADYQLAIDQVDTLLDL
jgi:epoxide hydrolase-like predicted phosphatase